MSEIELPPPPQRPGPNECCEGGCSPCVYDYYYEAVAEWQAKCDALKKAAQESDQTADD